MNCPVCNQPLIILELDQIEVDYCTNCFGVWLDEGELALVLESSNEKNKFLNSFAVDSNSKEKSVNCPICSTKMEKILCGEPNKITLDECKNKHGLWFNKGELECVVEMGSLDKQDKIVKLLKEMFSYNINK